MKREELYKIIEKLELENPKDKAFLGFHSLEDGDLAYIKANKYGLELFARELLIASLKTAKTPVIKIIIKIPITIKQPKRANLSFQEKGLTISSSFSISILFSFFGSIYSIQISPFNHFSFGSNSFGELGLGYFSNSNISIPTEINNKFTSFNIKKISSGYFHTLILDENGDIYSFGRNDVKIIIK